MNKKDSKANLNSSENEVKINITTLKRSVVMIESKEDEKREEEENPEEEEEEHWGAQSNNEEPIQLQEKIVVQKKNKNLEKFIQENK